MAELLAALAAWAAAITADLRQSWAANRLRTDAELPDELRGFRDTVDRLTPLLAASDSVDAHVVWVYLTTTFQAIAAAGAHTAPARGALRQLEELRTALSTANRARQPLSAAARVQRSNYELTWFEAYTADGLAPRAAKQKVLGREEIAPTPSAIQALERRLTRARTRRGEK